MSFSARSFLTASSANSIRRFGEHLTWIQEPDTFYMRLAGTLTGPELEGILKWQHDWGKNKPAYFVLCDLSKLGTVTREARRVMNERIPPANVTTVSYGASFGNRVIAEMATRARKALGMPAGSIDYYVATEADAKALLEKMRPK